jgi:hypothetical protein
MVSEMKKLDSPTGCATSFTSTAIRFESILHRFSFSKKRRCLNPCPWTSARVERACQGASIENTAAHGRPSGGLLSSAASTPRILAAGWLEEVEQHGEPELQACTRNLHKEESAVQAGLTLAWSNGPTKAVSIASNC